MVSKINKKWNHRFNQLKKFYEKQGHSNLSARYKRNKSLGTWVVRQRVIKNTLSEEQIEKLNSLEFVWEPRTNSWNQNFEKLMQYFQEHGDTNVPVNYREDIPFGRWVQKQRRIKNSLSDERLKQLNSLNFIWDGNSFIWQNNLSALKEYIRKNNEAPSYKTNLKLYNWLNQQKRKHLNDKLTGNQFEQLNEIIPNFGNE